MDPWRIALTVARGGGGGGGRARARNRGDGGDGAAEATHRLQQGPRSAWRGCRHPCPCSCRAAAPRTSRAPRTCDTCTPASSDPSVANQEIDAEQRRWEAYWPIMSTKGASTVFQALAVSYRRVQQLQRPLELSLLFAPSHYRGIGSEWCGCRFRTPDSSMQKGILFQDVLLDWA